MSSTYAGVAFNLILDAGAGSNWPLPETADDGGRRYRADVLMADRDAYEAMAARVSLVDLKRAGGLLGGRAYVRGGYGPGTLTVPTGAGETDDYTAVLVGFAPQAAARAERYRYRARCEWIVTDGPH